MSISRRAFVKTASTAGLGFLAAPALSQTSPGSTRPATARKAIADRIHLKGQQSYPGPGELHIGFGIGLAGGVSAVPVYLLEPNLTDQGRAAYARGLETCLKNVCDFEDKVASGERMQRLKRSIYCALDDVISLAYARETAKK